MPTVRGQGATLYYDIQGEAGRPALVFAHGMGGNAASWWQQVPVFARDYRVVTFDHRGFARSPCDTPADNDRARFVGDLAAILDHAGIDRATLICQSMGGQTGLGFALAHPGRVTALVLCATTGGISDDMIAARSKEIRPPDMRLADVVAQALAPDFAARQPALARLYAQLKDFNTAIDYSRKVADQPPLRIDPARLKGFVIPTLILTGEHDTLIPPDILRQVARLIPGSEFRLLAGVGHSAYCEDADTFNAVLGAFLSRRLMKAA